MQTALFASGASPFVLETYFCPTEPDVPANSSPTRKLFLLLGRRCPARRSFVLTTT